MNAQLPEASTLPFLFEDRTDEKVRRMLHQIHVARQWVAHQRRSGARPN